jgi:hypothetical protein
MNEKDAPLEFIGSSRDDLSGFPLEAKKRLVSRFARRKRVTKRTMQNR